MAKKKPPKPKAPTKPRVAPAGGAHVRLRPTTTAKTARPSPAKRTTVAKPAAVAKPTGLPVKHRRAARAAARPSAATTLASAAASTPPIDFRARAEKLLAELDALKRDVSANFYRMGLVLRELRPPEIYQSLGYTSFERLLDALDLGGRYKALQLIDVVETLPELVALELGNVKSYQSIRVVRKLFPRADPAKVIARDPEIAIDGDVTLPLSEITANDLIGLFKRLNSEDQAPVPGEAATHRAARRLAQRLHHADVQPESVSTKRKPDRWVVRLELTAAQANALSEVLERV